VICALLVAKQNKVNFMMVGR